MKETKPSEADTFRENIVVVETSKPVDEACGALERAIADHRFGILHTHNVPRTLANKGVRPPRRAPAPAPPGRTTATA